MRCKTIATLGLMVSLIQSPTAANGQAVGQSVQARHESQGTRTFGPTSITHTIPAAGFTGAARDEFSFYSTTEAGSRYCLGTSPFLCIFEAAVMLPSGASVTGIELEACDTSTAKDGVRASFHRTGPREGNPTELAVATTGSRDAPGCEFFFRALSSPESIDNFANTYRVRVLVIGVDTNARFQAVRLFYNLRVSPAPATANFDDVPSSHPFFQFIEALRASGITTGCSTTPALFCPDDPVTRGQMAVFFSRALGLHWP